MDVLWNIVSESDAVADTVLDMELDGTVSVTELELMEREAKDAVSEKLSLTEPAE